MTSARDHMESEFTISPLGGRPVGKVSPKTAAKLDAVEAQNVLYQGVTVNDLCVLFRMDRRTLIPKLTSIKPCGTRAGRSVYQIRDVAPVLVKPAGSIEDYIRKMRPNELPPLLSKEYWNGQRAKLAYLESVKDVWRTDKVIEVFANAFKTVRMSLLLLPDALDRSAHMTDHQREEIKSALDGALEDIRVSLVDNFSDMSEIEYGPGLGDDETTDEGVALQQEHDDTFDDGLDDDEL